MHRYSAQVKLNKPKPIQAIQMCACNRKVYIVY